LFAVAIALLAVVGFPAAEARKGSLSFFQNNTGVYYAYDFNVKPYTIREIVPMTEAAAWVLEYWDSMISSPKGSPTYQRDAVYRPSNTLNNASSLYVYTIFPAVV
jgi:hypothetical protein